MAKVPARPDYGPRQLADYLGAFYGQVDRAREFGLLPEPDRGGGRRWSAAAADRIHARWPEIAAAVECVGAPGLKERGWTEAMIRDLLGEPDVLTDNPHCSSVSAMMFVTASPGGGTPERGLGKLLRIPTPGARSLRRSYKFLLRPTCRQAAALAEMLEDHRQLYNAALEERREAWRMGRHSVSFFSQAAQLKDVRNNDSAIQGRWASHSQQATLRRLDRAFQAFYRRCKAGQKPGYPRFKGRGRWDSVTWQSVGSGVKWDSVPHPTVTRAYFKGIGHVRVHQHRPVKGTVKTVTVKRELGRWYMFLSCDGVPADSKEPTGAVVGIDMGVASFLTTSDGRHVPNPRPLAARAERLAAAQRSIAPKKRGSNRRRKAAHKVAGLHGKVRRTRLDHAHKTALALVRDHDLIVHEALKVASMTRRPKPKPDESQPGAYLPNGAAAKTSLNRSINDAGWGVFLSVLASKAESAGRVIVAVNPVNTSRRCAQCGHVAKGNRVSQAEFRCLACGHEAHADVNAAINILKAGLALRANAAREAA
jgi:putative transposase